MLVLKTARRMADRIAGLRGLSSPSVTQVRLTIESCSWTKTHVSRFHRISQKEHLVNETATTVDSTKEIDFENHTDAFRERSTWEILRALIVLRMCSVDVLVNNSLAVLQWSRWALGPHVFRWFAGPLLLDQFVGGEGPAQMRARVCRLASAGARPMIAVTMEEDIGGEGNENVYDNNCSRIMECLEIATADGTPSPMMQLKLSGLLPAELLVIIGNIYTSSPDKLKLVKAVARNLTTESMDYKLMSKILDEQQVVALKKATLRLKKIGQEAQRCGVKVLVDAEFTYLNPGLSLLTMAMVAVYNQNYSTVWNTYQCYLKDARRKILEELSLANQLGAHFGAKIVRGAYMLQERARAQKLQIQDPICKDYETTNNNYNLILRFCLEHMKKTSPKCSLIIASHNEESIKLAIEEMKKLSIDKKQGGVHFGQLYGMCDQVTYPLANFGYAVYKSIPYGTMDEVLPYLARRAEENRTVLEGARKEQMLLRKEYKCRFRKQLTSCFNS